MTLLRFFATVTLIVLATACVSHFNTSSPHSSKQAIVVTANPYATDVGENILRAGGSAVDAAIAIEAVLSLVEPQSSGLAGGAFMMHYDSETKKISVYDGRETAPKNVQHDMFLGKDGKSIGYLNAKHSGLSTGVPGVVSMFELAHEDHGKLPWGMHFDRAIELAQEGFAVSPRLHNFIKRFGKYLPSKPEDGPTDAYDYFFDSQGNPLGVGALRTNLAYADTLRILKESPKDFYRGKIANEIVDQVQQQPRAGYLTENDLNNYTAKRKQPLCSNYKEVVLCGPPPASSWVAVAEIMGIIEQSTQYFSEAGGNDLTNWALFIEAQRLAYADRDRYVADADFVNVPLEGLLNTEYLKQRAQHILPDSAIESVSSGNPWAFQNKQSNAPIGNDATVDHAGTTHFVIVDADGDVVSMTASVESIFGSSRMAGGMFLNNQLTDFSFKSVDSNGNSIANRIQAGKHPRSSMSPTIVLDKNGDFKMATGSPGGNSIIAYTAKTLVGVLEWGLTPQQAIELPNVVARGDKVRVEKERASSELLKGLKDYGFAVHESAGENSGLSVVERLANGHLVGAADPRREGTVAIINLEK